MHYDDERNKIVFHKTTLELQDQDRLCLVSDRSQTTSLYPTMVKKKSFKNFLDPDPDPDDFQNLVVTSLLPKILLW